MLNPSVAPAQDSRNVEFQWSSEASVVAVNALLGALSTGGAALLRGEPIFPAIATGAGGGALVYAGKRVAVQSPPGSGLIGRQLASIGGSIVGNEMVGHGPLDRIALAAGPVRIYVGREVAGTDWRIDVPAVAAAAFYGPLSGRRLDVGLSLSAGAMVFRDVYGGGLVLPGTILVGPSSDPDRDAYIFAHEKVHILQYDQSFQFWGAPLEGWIAQRVPVLRPTLSRFEFNLPVLTTAALLGFFVWERHADQPWEREAIYLGRTR
jgi:hypothetical protein